MFHVAITRQPATTVALGLTTADLGAPDLELTRRQHAAYVETLRRLGLEVLVLDPEPDFPDAHFVEDTAVVTREVAVVARPGAAARRGEEERIAPILARHRPLERIEPPGTLDGGDVLLMGAHALVGISERTNREGAAQLGSILESRGLRWTPVPLDSGLHLKSAVNAVADDTLLVTEAFSRRRELAAYRRLIVPSGEEYAANSLLVNHHLLMPAGHPQTRRTLERLGVPLVELDTSEFQKMDGGLTCLSVRF